MAKKFIQSAIKRPGRLRRMLGKKPGEKITSAEFASLAKKAKKTKNKSLASAVSLGRRLAGGEFRPGKTRF